MVSVFVKARRMAVSAVAVALLAGCSGGSGTGGSAPKGPGSENPGPPAARGSETGKAPQPGGNSGILPNHDFSKAAPLVKSKLNLPYKPDVKIPAPNSEGWHATKMTAGDLAKQVSNAIANMKGTYGEALTYLKTSGGTANATSTYMVQDRSHFRVDFVRFEDPPLRGFVLANGNQKRQLIMGKGGKSVGVKEPLPEAKLNASQLTQNWTRDFSRLMFLPLTDGVDAWSMVVPKIVAGTGGFKSTIEERVMKRNGKDVKSFRVRAIRAGTGAGKKGQCSLEMVVDAQFYLPVTVRVLSNDATGKALTQQWSCRWAFDAKFKPGDFEMIDPSKPGPAGPPKPKGGP
jgi:hypothetical protein